MSSSAQTLRSHLPEAHPQWWSSPLSHSVVEQSVADADGSQHPVRRPHLTAPFVPASTMKPSIFASAVCSKLEQKEWQTN